MKLRIKNVLALVCFILTFIILVLVQHSREYHNTPQIQTIPQIQKKPVKKPVKVIKQKEYIELYAKITAYTPGKESCGKHANGRTSINKNAWKMDGIAVDPKAIPYGTKVWIDGIGFKEADDTGGAMRQAWKKKRIVHIDVRMPTVWSAKQWGVQTKLIRVYL
jgi:3D (Asp-Asp-Asp) domain-containing protein